MNKYEYYIYDGEHFACDVSTTIPLKQGDTVEIDGIPYIVREIKFSDEGKLSNRDSKKIVLPLPLTTMVYVEWENSNE